MNVVEAQDTRVRGIYYLADDNIYRVDSEGSNQTLIVESTGGFRTIIADSEANLIYWSNGSEIRRASMGGGPSVIDLEISETLEAWEPVESQVYHREPTGDPAVETWYIGPSEDLEDWDRLFLHLVFSRP